MDAEFYKKAIPLCKDENQPVLDQMLKDFSMMQECLEIMAGRGGSDFAAAILKKLKGGGLPIIRNKNMRISNDAIYTSLGVHTSETGAKHHLSYAKEGSLFRLLVRFKHRVVSSLQGSMNDKYDGFARLSANQKVYLPMLKEAHARYLKVVGKKRTQVDIENKFNTLAEGWIQDATMLYKGDDESCLHSKESTRQQM